MSYKHMDQEFTELVNHVIKSDMCVEIIYEAIKTAQEHPYTSSPKLALQIAISDWEK